MTCNQLFSRFSHSSRESQSSCFSFTSAVSSSKVSYLVTSTYINKYRLLFLYTYITHDDQTDKPKAKCAENKLRKCALCWTERHTDLKVLLVGFIFEGLSLQLID